MLEDERIIMEWNLCMPSRKGLSGTGLPRVIGSGQASGAK